MLITIFTILIVIWLGGVISSYTCGGFIHVFLILAAFVLLVRFATGRNVT